jgi:hypothetical protein
LCSFVGYWNYNTTFLYIDPEDVEPPPDALGYFPLINQQDGLTYKINLELIEGNYHIRFGEVIVEETAANIFQIENIQDGLYYGIILNEFEDDLVITVAQSGTEV